MPFSFARSIIHPHGAALFDSLYACCHLTVIHVCPEFLQGGIVLATHTLVGVVFTVVRSAVSIKVIGQLGGRATDRTPEQTQSRVARHVSLQAGPEGKTLATNWTGVFCDIAQPAVGRRGGMCLDCPVAFVGPPSIVSSLQ